MDLTHDDVTEILALLDGSDVDYLEVRLGDTRLVADRNGLLHQSPAVAPPSPSAAAASASPASLGAALAAVSPASSPPPAAPAAPHPAPPGHASPPLATDPAATSGQVTDDGASGAAAPEEASVAASATGPNVGGGSGAAPPTGNGTAPATAAPGGTDAAADDGLVSVVAPVLGVFYAAPEPGAEPYVQPGSEVDADTTVGLIEVMKMFNSVAAPVAGTVERILVANEEFVEHGQPLMLVRPADG